MLSLTNSVWNYPSVFTGSPVPDNKLSINMEKTEVIILTSKRKRHLVKDLVVKCQDTTIKISSEVKFLYKHGSILNTSSRKIMYSSLIQSHIDYAISAWYLTKALKQKQVAQNNMARYILKSDKCFHVAPMNANTWGFSMLIYNQISPTLYLSSKFTRVNSTHNHATLSSENNFVVPNVTGLARHNFYYHAVKLWNDLPNNIKQIKSKTLFKSKVKSHLFDQFLSQSR